MPLCRYQPSIEPAQDALWFNLIIQLPFLQRLTGTPKQLESYLFCFYLASPAHLGILMPATDFGAAECPVRLPCWLPMSWWTGCQMCFASDAGMQGMHALLKHGCVAL